jgi:hypothetical protein
MSIRSALSAAAILCLAATAPAFAQSSQEETIGAGRSMGAPEGDVLTRPADPNVQPQGARQPPTGEAAGDDNETAATNVRPPPGSSSQPGEDDNAAQAKPKPSLQVPTPRTNSEAR